MQGSKIVTFGQNSYQYDEATYLVSSMHLSVSGQILKASAQAPFLCVQLFFNSEQMIDIIQHISILSLSSNEYPNSMGVGHVTEELLDAVVRLIKLWHQNVECEVIAPLIMKEILFRILQGEYGAHLYQFLVQGSNAYRIAKSIEFISSNIAAPLRVNLLAKKVGMSVPSFHRHFKQTTSLSPIQYQKLLRLQQARSLLYYEINEIGEVAYKVGYESASQFSREYSRFFGVSPSKDKKAIGISL